LQLQIHQNPLAVGIPPQIPLTEFIDQTSIRLVWLSFLTPHSPSPTPLVKFCVSIFGVIHCQLGARRLHTTRSPSPTIILIISYYLLPFVVNKKIF